VAAGFLRDRGVRGYPWLRPADSATTVAWREDWARFGRPLRTVPVAAGLLRLDGPMACRAAARRPNVLELAPHERLREYGLERLAGVIRGPGRTRLSTRSCMSRAAGCSSAS
jgi:hypothetical protein